MSAESEQKEKSLRISDPETIAKLRHGSIVPPEIWEPFIGNPHLKETYTKALEHRKNNIDSSPYLVFFGSVVPMMLYGAYYRRKDEGIAGSDEGDLDIYPTDASVVGLFNVHPENALGLPLVQCSNYRGFRDQYYMALSQMSFSDALFAEKYLQNTQSPEDCLVATAMFKHETVSLIMTQTAEGSLELKVYDPLDYLGDLRRFMGLANGMPAQQKLPAAGMPIEENISGAKSNILRAWAAGQFVPVGPALRYSMNISKLIHHQNFYDMTLSTDSDLQEIFITGLERLRRSKDATELATERAILKAAAVDIFKAGMLSPNDMLNFSLGFLPLGRVFSPTMAKIFDPLYLLRNASYEEKISNFEYVFASTALQRMLHILITKYEYSYQYLADIQLPDAYTVFPESQNEMHHFR